MTLVYLGVAILAAYAAVGGPVALVVSRKGAP